MRASAVLLGQVIVASDGAEYIACDITRLENAIKETLDPSCVYFSRLVGEDHIEFVSAEQGDQVALAEVRV